MAPVTYGFFFFWAVRPKVVSLHAKPAAFERYRPYSLPGAGAGRLERLAAGLRRAGMFAGGSGRRHLAGGALRRPGRGVARARRGVRRGGRLRRGARGRRAGGGRRGAAGAPPVPFRRAGHCRHPAGRGGFRAEVSVDTELNTDYALVGPRTVGQSKCYEPVLRLSEAVFPFLEWVGDRVPQRDE